MHVPIQVRPSTCACIWSTGSDLERETIYNIPEHGPDQFFIGEEAKLGRRGGGGGAYISPGRHLLAGWRPLSFSLLLRLSILATDELLYPGASARDSDENARAITIDWLPYRVTLSAWWFSPSASHGEREGDKGEPQNTPHPPLPERNGCA